MLAAAYLAWPSSRIPPAEQGSDERSGAETLSVDWQSFVALWPDANVYEPSAVLPLSDGRLLVAQDEAGDPFALLSPLGQKPASVDRSAFGYERIPEQVARADAPYGLNDLEGLAQTPDGFVYAITSHSLTADGDRRKAREKLVRMRFEGDRIVEYAIYRKLRKAILEAHPDLEKAAKSNSVKGSKGFGIEGLGVGRDGRSLLLGLRGPVTDEGSWILVLENPSAVFDEDASPTFAAPLKLDLDGGGIRAMSHVPALESYLLVTQRANKKTSSDEPFLLWSWSGEGSTGTKEINLGELDLRKTEGLTPIQLAGRDYLLLVSDDGDRAKRRSAHVRALPITELGP